MGILYRKKKHLYPLVTILGELVLYKDSIINLETGCYGPSVISVTVTKGEHLKGSRLYGTSGTIRRGVSRVI